MPGRDTLVKSLEAYLWAISTTAGYTNSIVQVARNPRDDSTKFPVVNIFEGSDIVFDVPVHGGGAASIIRKRRLAVALEMWLEPTTEGKATAEILSLYSDVRKALFQGTSAGTLNGQCVLRETEVSSIMKPTFGTDTKVVGVAMSVDIIYIDTPQETY